MYTAKAFSRRHYVSRSTFYSLVQTLCVLVGQFLNKVSKLTLRVQTVLDPFILVTQTSRQHCTFKTPSVRSTNKVIHAENEIKNPGPPHLYH